MKIIEEGRVSFGGGEYIQIEGWSFDMEGKSLDITEMAKVVLEYLKQKKVSFNFNKSIVGDHTF